MTYFTHTQNSGFSGFLKNWRTRRRLSQLDLSLNSGMSQRHISFLETGRSKPSLFAISQLADALEMPAAEVDAMLLSAGFAARSSRKGWNVETRNAVDDSIVHILQSHAPYPAASVDRIWNLIRANEPAQKFFAMVGGTGDPNLLREIMAPGEMRNSIVNWEDSARALFRMLELEVARRPHDEEAHHFIEELRGLHGVADLVSRPIFEEPRPVLAIQFRIGETILELFSMIATIGMSADAAIDDLRIETLLPANEETREWFSTGA